MQGSVICLSLWIRVIRHCNILNVLFLFATDIFSAEIPPGISTRHIFISSRASCVIQTMQNKNMSRYSTSPIPQLGSWSRNSHEVPLTVEVHALADDSNEAPPAAWPSKQLKQAHVNDAISSEYTTPLASISQILLRLALLTPAELSQDKDPQESRVVEADWQSSKLELKVIAELSQILTTR